MVGEDELVIDQPARDAATRAMAKIESHEDKCEIRWSQSMSTMSEVKDAINSFRSIFLGVSGGAFVMLLGVVGFLAARAVVFH